MKENLPHPLEAIYALLEGEALQEALQLLLTHLAELQIQLDKPELLRLLAAFPITLPVDLLCLQGKLLGEVGRYQEAKYILNQAKALAWQQQLWAQVIHCCLELALLYQRHEDFQTAFFYVQEAEKTADRLADEKAKAALYLRLAELCPDIGQLTQSIQYGREALHDYSMIGDNEGQFQALYLLAIVNRQMGQYDEASSRLEMARQYQQAGLLPSRYYGRILSAEAHLLWYQGRITEAISKGQIYRQKAYLDGLSKQYVYAHMLLGNLYRAAGKYPEAEKWYEEAESLVADYELPLYRPWVEIQKGWLKLLMGERIPARRHIHAALTTENRGMQMSFNVNLACLEILVGEYASAQNLLQLSRQFYAHSGDILSYQVIGLYLAYGHWQQGRRAEALVYLQESLQWFMERNILYFPNWWLPQVVAECCVMALTEEICTPLVERMFLNHLYDYQYMLLLDEHPDTAVRQRLFNLYELLADNDSTDILAGVSDLSVKSALQELLQAGLLRRETFQRLQQKLITAKNRHKHNPTCIAVFGLYLQGLNRSQIANKLGCSPTTVRNYITVAYQAFDIPNEVGTGTLMRKEQLRQLAQAEGFVG